MCEKLRVRQSGGIECSRHKRPLLLGVCDTQIHAAACRRGAETSCLNRVYNINDALGDIGFFFSPYVLR